MSVCNAVIGGGGWGWGDRGGGETLPFLALCAAEQGIVF